jgi:hypothetical protein
LELLVRGRTDSHQFNKVGNSCGSNGCSLLKPALAR